MSAQIMFISIEISDSAASYKARVLPECFTLTSTIWCSFIKNDISQPMLIVSQIYNDYFLLWWAVDLQFHLREVFLTPIQSSSVSYSFRYFHLVPQAAYVHRT
jgi:hypothetical protein